MNEPRLSEPVPFRPEEAPSAEFLAKISRLRDAVNARILAAVQKPGPVTLYEPMRYIFEAGGKRLRPILLLLSCEAVGGEECQALDAAVAVELLHTFTLIHDDVMDHDDTRRGRPTIHNKWDVSVAILSGDGLVALSYDYLLRTPSRESARLGSLFSRALLEVCEGQALDKEFESRWDVTLDEYFTMIAKKTATLIALCGELGGIIGGGTPQQLQALRDFGYHLGVAFQIQDDLLDITADEKELGKTWGSDIMQKKKTLLLLHALKNAPPADRKELKAILRQPQITPGEVLRVKAIFERQGTIDFARTCFLEHFQKAEETLRHLPSRQTGDLQNFLRLILNRHF